MLVKHILVCLPDARIYGIQVSAASYYYKQTSHVQMPSVLEVIMLEALEVMMID